MNLAMMILPRLGKEAQAVSRQERGIEFEAFWDKDIISVGIPFTGISWSFLRVQIS